MWDLNIRAYMLTKRKRRIFGSASCDLIATGAMKTIAVKRAQASRVPRDRVPQDSRYARNTRR